MKAKSDDPAAGHLVNRIKLPGSLFLWSANAQPSVERRAAFLIDYAHKYKVSKFWCPWPQPKAVTLSISCCIRYLAFAMAICPHLTR